MVLTTCKPVTALKKAIIGSKLHSEDISWREVLEKPEKFVDTAILGSQTQQIINQANYFRKKGARLCLAWSGGKDSIVVHHILAETLASGFRAAYADNLEFGETLAWMNRHRPSIVFDVPTPITWDYLKKRPTMLFPTTAKQNSYWNAHKWKVQRNVGLSRPNRIVVMGRRNADGNRIFGADGYHVSAEGLHTWNPIWNWSNEEVAAYISLHSLPLPPCYDRMNGFAHGLRPWPLTSYNYVYNVEPSLIPRFNLS